MGASMRKAIVLGGYGLIGRACMGALENAGFEVVGVGRSRHAALAADANATWLIRDIPTISVHEWRLLLGNVDVVVNAAGALQDGARDGLETIHVATVARLVEATKGHSLTDCPDFGGWALELKHQRSSFGQKRAATKYW
jgi:nucleoside-diphosphate-sugar epimerase